MPKVTVIILNFNGLLDTRECISSVLKTDYPNFEVVVIDNGSKENQASKLVSEFKDPRVKIIRNEINYGFAEGNNRGIQESDAPYVILLNNDTTVEKDWIHELVKVAESDSKIAALQPKIRSYFEQEYFEYAGAAGGYIDKLGYPYARGRVGFELEKDLGQYNTNVEIFWASGSCILLRKSVLAETGLLPTDFFFHHEEIDLCWRIKNLGYKIVCAPKSIIYHKGLGSSKDILPKKVFFVHKNNLLLLARNMSISRLLYVLPLRMAMDYVSCLFYLTKGQLFYIGSVLKAHAIFLKQGLPIILGRIINKQEKKYPAEHFLKPFSIYFEYFVQKKKRFSEIIPSDEEKVPTIYYEKILPGNVIEKNNKQIVSFLQTPHTIFFLLATILCISWFRSRMLIVSGEESLVFFNPGRIIQVYNSPWYETGTGFPMPVVQPRVPLLFIAWFFSSFLKPFLAQAIIYWLLLISGLSGMYAVSKKLIKDEKAALIIALFYLLNIYSMSQIWGRLLTTGTTLWAYLPWFLLTWMEWVTTGQKKYFFSFLLLSIPYSYAFGQPSAVLVLWLIAGIYTVTSLTIPLGKNRKIIARAVAAWGGWTVANTWWIYPYLKMGANSFETINQSKENLSSLAGVSQFFPISQILLLRQTAIFSSTNYGGWYLSSEAYWISWLILVFVLLGVFFLHKNRSYLFVFLVFVFGLIISKGTNAPFGEQLFSWLFQTIPASQSLRNSYEKAGIIFLFPYAIFFGAGVQIALSRIKNRSILLVSSGLIFFLCIGILVWPMWKGTVYGAGVGNTHVKVPIDYEIINKKIREDHSDGRIVHLPIVNGDGMEYLWPTGKYSGLEPSEFLFDNPSISKILRTPYYDSKYLQLYKSFGKENFQELLKEMDVRYLVLHKDNGVVATGVDSTEEVKKKLQLYPNIKLEKEEKNLELYLNSDAKKNTRITADAGINISYERKSPMFYTVTVKDSNRPFRLIFKETFNKNWQASIGKELLTSHTKIYEYANSWAIDKKGSYTIEVRFRI